MPRGDKSKYSDKQKRKAEHIEEGYKKRGVPEDEADAGPGRRSTRNQAAATNPEVVAAGRIRMCRARRGASSGVLPRRLALRSERSASAKKAAATRKRNAGRAGR